MKLAQGLLVLPLRFLHTPTGRRLALLAVLSLALVALVTTLYDHAEAPPGRTRALAVAEFPVAAPARASAAPAALTAAAPAGKDPGEVAAAWYADRNHVDRRRVRPLQQQRVSADRIRVLVMAQTGPARLDSAFVQVTRSGSGWVAR